MAALLEKAFDQFNRGDFKIALATIRRLLEKDRRNLDAHLLAGTIHEQQGNLAEAARFFADAVPLTPDRKRDIGLRAAAHYLSAGRRGDAASALMALHPFMPNDRDVNHGLCSIFREAGLYSAALPYAETLAAEGNGYQNWLNAGIVLSGLERHADAFAALKKAHEEQPEDRLALSELFWCAANLGDLSLCDRLQAALEAAYAREGERADIRENAFRALCWSDDPAYLRRTAELTAQLLLPPPQPPRAVEKVTGRKIRLGYVSADFADHATMALLAGVLEAHDHEAFEVFAFCHTPEPMRKGPMRERFLKSGVTLVDILTLDDAQAAASIRKAGIDILIDLKGFTQSSRLGLFAARPAPVQVTWLGFPGTVAGVAMDHAITDWVVTPPGSERFFAEKLIRMPHCYQPNDRQRPRFSRPAFRARFGLPEAGLVFAAFHQVQKIRSGPFAAWMAILKDNPGSVLWLLDHPPVVRENLERAAAAHGIEADRLVYAPKKPLPEHLERLAAADIALDTGPYNGHTTTSDALWCGVPVVTFRGKTFAGRVSESLLSSVGLSDLVADDLIAFVRLTNALAQDGNRLSILRQKLVEARDTAPLFDTERFTRALEERLAALVS